MVDTEQKSEECISERLSRSLQLARPWVTSGDVKFLQLNMWSGAIRAQIKKLYGEDSELLQEFLSLKEKPAPGVVQSLLVQRVNKVERFFKSLNEAKIGIVGHGNDRKVFIGHGRSPLWRELKDFISDRLHLPWDEFNREAVAGFSTFKRLSIMLDEAMFAFMVMTGEDEYNDATLRARQNVVHEIGLFQGRLGPERAIVLLEDGCAEFSNIVGLSEIRFPKGRISAAFEDIRRVLEREGIIDP